MRDPKVDAMNMAEPVKSLSWHRRKLSELFAIVEAKGLPHLFATLTEDEVNGTRWPGFDNIEAVMPSSFDSHQPS